MAYKIVQGNRLNPQGTAVTGTPIRTSGQWPLYYGATPVSRTAMTTTDTVATSVDETQDTPVSDEFGAGGSASPDVGIGTPSGADIVAGGLLKDAYSPAEIGFSTMRTLSGPLGAIDSIAGLYGRSAEAHKQAEALADLGVSNVEMARERAKALSKVKGLSPFGTIQAIQRVRNAFAPPEDPLGFMDTDTYRSAEESMNETGIGPGQESDVGITGPSPTGMTDTSGFTGLGAGTVGGGYRDAGASGPSMGDTGDFDGAYGDFGYGMGKGTGDVGDTGYGGGTDSGAGVGGVGAGTNSYGGGYSGGYGMDAGIGRSGGYGDDNEGGMGTGSGGLGGLG